MKKNTNTQAQTQKETVNYIAKRCKGLISKKDIALILSDLDDSNYELVITSDAKKISAALTLSDCTGAHSWAGNWGAKDEGSVLFGNCCFGTHYQYQYFDNGTPEEPIDWVKDPQFNTEKTLVVLIHSHIWDHYDGAEEDNYGKKLLIFLPPAKQAV